MPQVNGEAAYRASDHCCLKVGSVLALRFPHLAKRDVPLYVSVRNIFFYFSLMFRRIECPAKRSCTLKELLIFFLTLYQAYCLVTMVTVTILDTAWVVSYFFLSHIQIEIMNIHLHLYSHFVFIIHVHLNIVLYVT